MRSYGRFSIILARYQPKYSLDISLDRFRIPSGIRLSSEEYHRLRILWKSTDLCRQCFRQNPPCAIPLRGKSEDFFRRDISDFLSRYGPKKNPASEIPKEKRLSETKSLLYEQGVSHPVLTRHHSRSLYRQLLPSLLTTVPDHVSPSDSTHALQKSVPARPSTGLRLIGPLHTIISTTYLTLFRESRLSILRQRADVNLDAYRSDIRIDFHETTGKQTVSYRA